MDIKENLIKFGPTKLAFSIWLLLVIIACLCGIYGRFFKTTVVLKSNIVEIKEGKQGIDGNNLINQIEEVLKSNPNKIIIKANSTGGRIVQGEKIYKYIKSINIPVHTYIENECLSACYYGISSSDKIYSYKSSTVGNIGVTHPEPKPPFKIFAWSGKYKNSSNQKDHIQKHLTKSAKLMHTEVVKDIKESRGNRIKGTDDQLFEGLIWTGIEAKKLGLIDEYGNLNGL
jgi:protease IV